MKKKQTHTMMMVEYSKVEELLQRHKIEKKIMTTINICAKNGQESGQWETYS